MARSLSQLFYALGGSVSPGKSNDELIDHLIDAEFIRTPAIQRVFRSVDRGNYYHPSHRQNAYKDIAWRMGNLHLSAPCVYSVVMETLKLKPGLSFLNLGSGSGYLSTMAGLLLGQYGINHGIEFHEDIVEYAYERLDEFLKNSKVVDEHDFCEPVFTCGNCLTLDANVQQYDRVYCGAACPEEYEAYIKNLVKINGILIMPLNDKLLKITRVNETNWTTVKVLSVSFAPLILPPSTKKGETIDHAKLGDIIPPTLLQLCRFKVREHLRSNIETEHPKLVDNLKKLPPRKNLKLFIIDCGTDSNNDESDSDDDGGGENLDSFSLMMRSVHRTSFLLRNFSSQVDYASSTENSEVGGGREEEEEEDEVLKFASLTTVRDAVEEEVDSSEEEKETTEGKCLPVVQDHQAKEVVDNLSENEKTKRDAEPSGARVKRATRSQNKMTSTSSKDEEGVKNCSKTGRRSKNVSKASTSSAKVEKGEEAWPNEPWPNIKVDKRYLGSSPKFKNTSAPSSSLDLSLPPSRSTRSKTNALKRDLLSLDDGPSTSAGCSSLPPKKKRKKSKPTTQETFSRGVKLDSNNKILEEFSHTYYLTQRIAALPLPPYLKKYMNYERENF